MPEASSAENPPPDALHSRVHSVYFTSVNSYDKLHNIVTGPGDSTFACTKIAAHTC